MLENLFSSQTGSRMMFGRAYPRETQEMVFDAHDSRAFAFFGGACTRGIYGRIL